jgi:hypothetical protein
MHYLNPDFYIRGHFAHAFSHPGQQGNVFIIIDSGHGLGTPPGDIRTNTPYHDQAAATPGTFNVKIFRGLSDIAMGSLRGLFAESNPVFKLHRPDFEGLEKLFKFVHIRAP